VESPAVYGLWRKRLLLPDGIFERFSTDELRCIFLRELAHIKRGDLAVNWLVAALRVLHWFNPVLWLAWARMRADRELATDALALAHVRQSDHASYGETILKVLEGLTGEKALPGLVGIVENKAQLKERLAAIVRPGKHWRWAALAVTALIACIGLTGAQTENPESAPAGGPLLTSAQPVRASAAATARQPESPPSQTDYFTALQGLLNNDYAEYEIAFSIVDTTVQPDGRQMAQIASPNAGPGGEWSRTYTQPGFYRLRRAQDGFFAQTGRSLDQVQKFALDTNEPAQVSGAYANAWWQFGHGLLFLDFTRFPALQNQELGGWEWRMGRGISFTRFPALQNHEFDGAAKDLADAAEQDILSLGLCLKRGSVAWDGTHFTAETGTHISTPADLRGRRIVIGDVILSNGIPSQLDAQISTAHFSIRLGYDPVISARFKIPSQMDVVRTGPESGANHLVFQIHSLQVTNFPPGSTSPALFADANSSLSVIEKYSTGPGPQTCLVILRNKSQMEKFFSRGETRTQGNNPAGPTNPAPSALPAAPGMRTQGSNPAGPANPAIPDPIDNYAGFTTLPKRERDLIFWELQEPDHNWWGLPEQKYICRDLLATQGYSSFANNATAWTSEAINLAEKQGCKDLTPLITKIYERPMNIWVLERAFSYLRGQSGRSVSTNVTSSFQVLQAAGNYQSSVSDDELAAAKERLLKEPDKEALLVHALEIAGWNAGKGGSQRGREAAADVLKSLDRETVIQRLRQLRQDAAPKGMGDLLQSEYDWIAQRLGISIK